jgi:hypothetical protein
MVTKIWDKKESINGVSAEAYLDGNPLIKETDTVVLVCIDDGTVTQVLNVEIVRANMGLANTLTPLQVGEAYLKSLDPINEQTQINNNSDLIPQLAAVLKSVTPNFDIIKSLFDMQQIIKDDVFNYVKSGDITPNDYLTIIGEQCPSLPLDTVKQNKINELNIKCKEVITTGFYSDADGEQKHYDFTLEDQVNISTIARKLELAKLAGQTTVDGLTYYTKGEIGCHPYTMEQFLKLDNDGEVWKTMNLRKYRDGFKPIVLACTTSDEVNAITWETVIPTEQTTSSTIVEGDGPNAA